MTTNIIEFPNLDIVIRANPEAFVIPGLDMPVYKYGLIICTAVVLALVYALRTAPKIGLVPEAIFDLAFWGVICGVIGARTYYVVFSETDYDLYTAVFGIRDGGLALYGGLIGAFVGIFLGTKIGKIRIKVKPLLDLLGIGFLIGTGIGRWGNFFNQEAYGAPTAGNLPWGMTGNEIISDPDVARAMLADSGALVHPCFLYESLLCLTGFVLLHVWLRKWRTFDGEVFLLFVMWYGTGRTFIESLRMDSLMLGSVRVSQMLSVAAVTVALVVYIRCKSKLTSKNGYKLYKDTDESRDYVANYRYTLKLDSEKEAAKAALKKTERELTDPFSRDE